MDTNMDTVAEQQTRKQMRKITTVTKTVVRRRQSALPSVGDNRYMYEEEEWQRETGQQPMLATKPRRGTPKTDYTYSRSGSYSSQVTDESCTSPNMSRRGLHGTATYLSVPSVMVSAASPAVETPVIYAQSHRQTEHLSASYTEDHTSKSSHTSDRSRNRNGLPASATRSGTEYGLPWEVDSSGRRIRSRKGGIFSNNQRRSLQVQVGHVQNDLSYIENQKRSVTPVPKTLDYEESMLLGAESSIYSQKDEKRHEYAGESSMYKERTIHHLFGLDHTDTEYSDEDFPDVIDRRKKKKVPTATLR